MREGATGQDRDSDSTSTRPTGMSLRAPVPAGTKPPSWADRAFTAVPLGRYARSNRKFLARELAHGAQANEALSLQAEDV